MTKSESLTAKVILDNETYEFSIEDGETLQLELKHVNQKIFVQKKEVSQLYPNGQPRIAFNDSKANVTTPLAFADQEFESSINDILEEQTQNKVDISEQKIEEDSGEELNKNSEHSLISSIKSIRFIITLSVFICFISRPFSKSSRYSLKLFCNLSLFISFILF